ncbi:transposable element Tcb1 transposase [Trichonephila clavipes]|nr:transposable element Tcb1 transposase [Trichonephila clavipes]
MMEAGLSVRRVSRQLGRSDCVVRKCYDQWPTASSAAVQGQVAPSLGAPLSSRTLRRHLAEGHLGSLRPLRALDAHPLTLRSEWCRERGNWTAEEWNHVVFSDESRFNLSWHDNRGRVWKPHGERLNSVFALQRHTATTAVVMVWGDIAYNTRSPLVFIRGTMTAQRYVHDIRQPHVLPFMQRIPGDIFHENNARPHTARMSQDFIRTVPTLPSCLIPRFVSNQAYMGSFRMASWASHEFERTRGRVTANMKRNVSRHHTKPACRNTRSCHFAHSC